ncbi:MAG: hypothetical protein JKY93_11735 [Gammaproteobacteria bacterium]|nr:hypothetical protein [Gammaproteobacteria bacterium]
MRFGKILLLGAFLSASTVQANELEIALSSDTAFFGFTTDSSAIGYGGADLNFGLLFNEADDVALSAGLTVLRQPDMEAPLTFGVGVKAYYVDIDRTGDTATSIAIGGQIKYTIPAKMPVNLVAEYYFSPDITTFGDADGLDELNLRVELEVMPQTMGYIGLRKLEIDGKDGSADTEISDDIQFGVRIAF